MTSQFLHLAMVLLFLQAPALNSPSPRERTEAIRSMSVLGDRDAVGPLVEAYRNEPRRDIRLEIVGGLGRIRDRGAIPGLTEALLTDFQRDVRLQAIDSLLRLYIPIADNEGFFSFVTGITRVFAEDDRPRAGSSVVVDPAVTDALLAALREDSDAGVRREAVHALGSLNASARIGAIIGELEGPRHREDSTVRVAMVEVLGNLRDPQAGPVLTTLMRDGDDDVAASAIRSVGLIGYQPAAESLRNLFGSTPDDDVRELALQSLALLRAPESQTMFETLLDDDEESIRELAAEGLARLDYDASGLVARIADERDAGVRLAMAFAIVASGDTGFIQRIVDELDTRRYPQAEAYLYELGRFEGRLDDLHPHLRNPDADIRERLVRVIGDIGNPQSRPYIQPLTEDRDGDVAAAAVEALRRLTGA
jgi:HEAT repeat protein